MNNGPFATRIGCSIGKPDNSESTGQVDDSPPPFSSSLEQRPEKPATFRRRSFESLSEIVVADLVDWTRILIPALLIKTSIEPNAYRQRSTMARQSSSQVTSAAKPIADVLY